MVKNDDENSNRWSNLCEFATLADSRSVTELDEFLDQIALVSDADALDAQGASAPYAAVPVTLSTVHGAKGLEFDHVFICGVEEGLFPHFYSSDDALLVNEERRLLDVAITRAKHAVVLSHASSRGRYGNAT
jgi:DNA helicase II / ATP-dependent DNA helicase PcrA